jgi:hypothetical protein
MTVMGTLLRVSQHPVWEIAGLDCALCLVKGNCARRLSDWPVELAVYLTAVRPTVQQRWHAHVNQHGCFGCLHFALRTNVGRRVRYEFVVGISKSGCAGDRRQLDTAWHALNSS